MCFGIWPMKCCFHRSRPCCAYSLLRGLLDFCGERREEILESSHCFELTFHLRDALFELTDGAEIRLGSTETPTKILDSDIPRCQLFGVLCLRLCESSLEVLCLTAKGLLHDVSQLIGKPFDLCLQRLHGTARRPKLSESGFVGLARHDGRTSKQHSTYAALLWRCFVGRLALSSHIFGRLRKIREDFRFWGWRFCFRGRRLCCGGLGCFVCRCRRFIVVATRVQRGDEFVCKPEVPGFRFWIDEAENPFSVLGHPVDPGDEHSRIKPII